jgi:hypothetical protein
MRTAPPEALACDVRPALTAHLSKSDLRRLFPMEFSEVDSLSAAEPSRAALLSLESGKLVLLEYGALTSTLTISVPSNGNARETLDELLIEAPLSESSIEWLSDDVGDLQLYRAAEQMPVLSSPSRKL